MESAEEIKKDIAKHNQIELLERTVKKQSNEIETLRNLVIELNKSIFIGE